MNDRRIRTSIETEFEFSGCRARGRIQNMSEDGLFVGTRSIPDRGENIHLRFQGPGGREFSVSGLVWWTTADDGGRKHRTSGFGMRLLDVGEDYHCLLAII